MGQLEATIEITDNEKYQRLISEVELNGVLIDNNVFDGNITLFLKDHQVIPCYGLLQSDEFQDDYGFVIRGKKQNYTSDNDDNVK